MFFLLPSRTSILSRSRDAGQTTGLWSNDSTTSAHPYGANVTKLRTKSNLAFARIRDADHKTLLFPHILGRHRSSFVVKHTPRESHPSLLSRRSRFISRRRSASIRSSRRSVVTSRAYPARSSHTNARARIYVRSARPARRRAQHGVVIHFHQGSTSLAHRAPVLRRARGQGRHVRRCGDKRFRVFVRAR